MRVLAERWTPWVAAAVLVAGIAAFAVTRLDRSSPVPAPPHRAAKLTAAELQVAHAFLDTAVARKHLDRAWAIVAPELKDGMSLEEWKKGTIPVVPYPVGEADVTLKPVDSFTDVAQLRVTFVPHAGTKAAAATFLLGLRNVDGHWLASAWQPSSPVAPHKGA
jgi:hypothetical protein